MPKKKPASKPIPTPIAEAVPQPSTATLPKMIPPRPRMHWSPTTIEGIIRKVVRHALTGWTANAHAAHNIAKEIAKDVRDIYTQRARVALGVSPDATVNWREVAIANVSEAGTSKRLGGEADCTSKETDTSAGTSTADAQHGATRRGRATSRIDPAEVEALVRGLLTRASDGDVSASDSIKVAELAARLGGYLNAQASRDLTISLIMYDTEAYREAVRRSATPERVSIKSQVTDVQ
jgi:hypothetical protein